MRSTMTVWVPAPEAHWRAAVAAGSAIVGYAPQGMPHQCVRIYFEGGLYGQVGMERFAGRVLHAAGRCEHEYPTTAQMLVERDTLIPVGAWIDGELFVPDDEARQLIADWLGEDQLDPAELVLP